VKRETMLVVPEKHIRRIGVLPTYVQNDRTKYSHKAKHKHASQQDHSAADIQEIRCRMVSESTACLAQMVEQSPRKR
jgi:hypothetical protein